MNTTSKKHYFKFLNLSKKRLSNLLFNELSDIDVCSKFEIDKYEDAVKTILEYNTAYEQRLSKNRKNKWYVDAMAWNIREQLDCFRNMVKTRNPNKKHPIFIQIKTRQELLKRYLVEKWLT